MTTATDVYTYDDADNVTSVAEARDGATIVTFTYCYHGRGQLVDRQTTTACSGTNHDEHYAYDAAGNRTSALVGGTTTNYAYDAAGRLCAVGATTCASPNVTYDSIGRTATYAGWTFAYDAEGRMVSACKSPTCASGFDTVTFAYDGDGHRTQIKTTSASGAVSTTDFGYAGDAIVSETLTDASHPTPGTMVRRYIVDADGSIVKIAIPAGEANAGDYFVTWNGHGDALNLLRINADGSTTLANSYAYSSWGAPSTSTHNGISDLGFRFLYVGRHDVQWDNAFGLGLLYMHARHYAPVLGRFLQPDPAAADSNLYGHATATPVSRTDASGLYFQAMALGGGGGGGRVGLALFAAVAWVYGAILVFVLPARPPRGPIFVPLQHALRESPWLRLGSFIRWTPPRSNRLGSRAGVDVALSRLAASDASLTRVRHGLYWKSPVSRFGPAKPRPFDIAEREGVGPAGWTALHLLGLTTQVPSIDEVAVLGPAPMRVSGTVYRSRSNPERAGLRFYEIAALEALRLAPAPNSAESSAVVDKLRDLTKDGAVRWKKLRHAAEKEPPRVRETIAQIDGAFALVA